MISVKVAAPLVIVILFTPDHDAVSDECPQSAHVRIVGATDPSERAVVAILIEINLLPVAVGIRAERIRNVHRLEGPRLGTGGEQTGAACQA